MTKKDYILIARVLAESNWPFDDNRAEFLREIVDDLCRVFQSDNPNFNFFKFAEAVFGKRT